MTRCGGQRRRLLVVLGSTEEDLPPAGVQAQAAAGCQALESEFSQEPQAPPTPSALLSLLPTPLLLLVLPGILPGTRPSDVLPLVQVGLLHLLQENKPKRKKNRIQDISFFNFRQQCAVSLPNPSSFWVLGFYMMRFEKARC